MSFQTFISTNCILLNKTKICGTSNVPLSYDRQSMLCEHRTKFFICKTIVRLYHECLAKVVGLSYDSRATFVRFFFIKLVYVSTHDNVFSDSHQTVTRQKIVDKKRCMSYFRPTTHDTATMLKKSCDCRTMITNDPRFD